MNPNNIDKYTLEYLQSLCNEEIIDMQDIVDKINKQIEILYIDPSDVITQQNMLNTCIPSLQQAGEKIFDAYTVFDLDPELDDEERIIEKQKALIQYNETLIVIYEFITSFVNKNQAIIDEYKNRDL